MTRAHPLSDSGPGSALTPGPGSSGMTLDSNASNPDDAVERKSSAATTPVSSAVEKQFCRYPQLHRLLNQLLQDSENYVNELIAEIRVRRDKKRSRQNTETKPTTKRRTRLLPSTKAVLQKWFEDHISYPYPTAAEKQQLIELCGGNVTPAMVANWFFNTRKRVNWRPASAQNGTGRGGKRPPKPTAQQKPPLPHHEPLEKT